MKKILYFAMFVGLAVLILAMHPAPSALASPSTTTFTVDTPLDLIDADTTDGTCLPGSCSLRAAIMQANVMTGLEVDIIVPSGTYTLTRPPTGANGPDSGDLNLTTPGTGSPLISIIGAGAGSTFVDANQIDRVFVIEAGRQATISGLTIRNGLPLSTGSGGGLYNAGTLTLTQVIVSANQAPIGGGLTNSSGTLLLLRSTLNANRAFFGGGLYNASGTLSVVQSTISGNTASGYGGGIYNQSGQLATVLQSTLSSNSATETSTGGGGGIYNFYSTNLVVVNSTLSQNSANNNGGGIWNIGTSDLYNTSVVSNMADADADVNGGTGGGIWNGAAGTFTLRHSLVAGNTATDPRAGYDDCTGTLNAFGWNLFWVVSGCTVNTYNSTWGTLSLLAVIGPLQNNGGPTWTHALLASSEPIGNPIDAGGLPAACIDNNSVPLVTDQRGALRSVDGDHDGVARCDIGAYEYQPPLFLPLIWR